MQEREGRQARKEGRRKEGRKKKGRKEGRKTKIKGRICLDLLSKERERFLEGS